MTWVIVDQLYLSLWNFSVNNMQIDPSIGQKGQEIKTSRVLIIQNPNQCTKKPRLDQPSGWNSRTQEQLLSKMSKLNVTV